MNKHNYKYPKKQVIDKLNFGKLRILIKKLNP